MEFIQQMAHKSWLPLLIAILLLFLSVYAEAEMPKAEEILQNMVKSIRTMDFKGKVTFMSMSPFGTQMREAAIIRKAPDKGRIEILLPLDERGSVMGMNGKERWFVQGQSRDNRNRRGRGPRRRPFMPPDQMADSLMRNARFIRQNYNIQVFAGGNVAGRDTYLVEVKSERTIRPSAKIWLDSENSVILKIEHYDSQNRLRELLVFNKIEFKPQIDDAIFIKPEGGKTDGGGPRREEIWDHRQGKLDLIEIKKELPIDVVFPKQVPLGFSLQSIQILKFGERKNVHLIYTDGLAMLSVFQSESEGDGRGRRGGPPGGRPEGKPEGKRRDRPSWQDGDVEKMNINNTECTIISRGSMFIFSWNYKEIYITLMGELERKEMIEVASSFINNNE